MNISRNWLARYVTIDCDLETLCDKLTMAGIEVEAVESAGTVPAGVVTGRILTRKPHPDSDHMSVCTVDIGGGTVLQIVCGAPNCDAGCVVPVATIGTVFHTPEGDFKIKKSKLRGVESQGMMCSEKELGLSDNHEGLMILDPATELGQPVDRLFPGDTRIEIEVTPNRPDWLSMWGVARDVSCLLGTEAKLPEITIPVCDKPAPGLVTVEAPDLCTRYIGRLIRNVKIGPSPEWIQKSLESVGLRPINNVVDVTNFVMMELGQPLHAFDLAKLKEGRVIARRAKSGEKISVIIPNKDHIRDLDLCIRSIIQRSEHRELEFIVVENNSTEPETFSYYEKIEGNPGYFLEGSEGEQPDISRITLHVIRWEREFNYSAINNFGRKAAKGDYLLLLNNDVEVINGSWLREMLSLCSQPGVGIVGAVITPR